MNQFEFGGGGDFTSVRNIYIYYGIKTPTSIFSNNKTKI